MDVGKARAIALFKYGIIAPACGGFLSECSKEAYYREAAKKKYTMPDECLSFEFDHANDCWQADTVDGPWLRADGMPARQTYLISFIDDASRLHPMGNSFSTIMP